MRFWLLALVLFACGGRGAPCPRSGAVYDEPAAKSDGATPTSQCSVRR